MFEFNEFILLLSGTVISKSYIDRFALMSYSGSSSVFVEGTNFGDCPVTLPPAQVNLLLARGDIVCNDHNASGQHAGIAFTPDGGLTFACPGHYTIKRINLPGGKNTVRTAQYLCGITGLLIVNMIILFDEKERMANIKDFMINFSSDILAVGVVLLMAEFVDRHRERMLGGDAPPHRNNSAGSIYNEPFRSVL